MSKLVFNPNQPRSIKAPCKGGCEFMFVASGTKLGRELLIKKLVSFQKIKGALFMEKSKRSKPVPQEWILLYFIDEYNTYSSMLIKTYSAQSFLALEEALQVVNKGKKEENCVSVYDYQIKATYKAINDNQAEMLEFKLAGEVEQETLDLMDKYGVFDIMENDQITDPRILQEFFRSDYEKVNTNGTIEMYVPEFTMMSLVKGSEGDSPKYFLPANQIKALAQNNE